MAHTATATRGLELVGYTTDATRLLVPGDPGITYTPGEPVIIGATGGAAGLVIKTGTNGIPVGVVTGRKIVCPSIATAFPIFGKTEGNQPVFGNESQTLVEVMPIVPVGTPIWKATFVDHWDDTVITYTAATANIAGTGIASTNDYPNGALAYFYEGPGAGEWNVVDDYASSGESVTFHRTFNATLTSSSKYILVGGEGASDRGVSFFRRAGLKTATDDLEVDDHSNDGLFMVFADARTISQYLHQLTLPIVPAPLNFLA